MPKEYPSNHWGIPTVRFFFWYIVGNKKTPKVTPVITGVFLWHFFVKFFIIFRKIKSVFSSCYNIIASSQQFQFCKKAV